jgi:hypothetical protein
MKSTIFLVNLILGPSLLISHFFFLLGCHSSLLCLGGISSAQYRIPTTLRLGLNIYSSNQIVIYLLPWCIVQRYIVVLGNLVTLCKELVTIIRSLVTSKPSFFLIILYN